VKLVKLFLLKKLLLALMELNTVSSIDLAIKNNESPEKMITKSRETTPKKSQPIPISPSKLLSVSSTPLTINTSTASISPLLVSPDTTVKSNIDSGTTAANNIITGNAKSPSKLLGNLMSKSTTSPTATNEGIYLDETET
jgi:hypothetical protein